MSDAMAPRIIRPAWVWGGALLALSGLLPLLVQNQPVSGEVVAWAGAVAFAAAMILFAFGRDSVVARRPLGVSALLLLGVWPLLARAIWALVPTELWLSDAWRPWALAIGYVEVLVPFAAAVIAVVQIARVGAVSQTLRRLPLIALVIVAVPYVATQIVGVAVTAAGSQLADVAGYVSVLGPLSVLCSLVATVGLGVVAIVASLPLSQSAVSGDHL